MERPTKDEPIVDAVAHPDLEVEKEQQPKDHWEVECSVDLEKTGPGRDVSLGICVEGW